MLIKSLDYLISLADFENDRVPWLIQLSINSIGAISGMILLFIIMLFMIAQYVFFLIPFLLLALLIPRYKLKGNNRAAWFCQYYKNIFKMFDD
jgi:hypothetical protein